MPKSRGRKPHNRSRKQQRRPAPRRTPGRGGLDPIAIRAESEDFLPLMRASDAAEARGDAAGALDVIGRRPYGHDGKPFWRPWRVTRLWQLARLGSVLPRWATSRWILAQAAQGLGPTDRLRHQRALQVALQVRGAPGGDLRELGMTAVDVMDHDWVHRQLVLYELGGLDSFLRREASPALLAGADRIEQWARTPMGGYRLLAEDPLLLRWAVLGTGETVETPNLGAASLLGPGDCALGRLVPIEEGAMFEAAPLFVPEHTAMRVAGDPDGWIQAVAEACQDDSAAPEQQCSTGGHDFELLTDVPLVVQLLAHHDVGASGLWTEDCVCLVLAALSGHFEHRPDAPPWPSVAAALLQPHVADRLALLLGEEDRDALRHLADTIAGPAAALCRELVPDLGEAA
ncbi:hypothetical protein [Nocardioides panaciterrulae]|uniref:Uncharacterized protein n=1 Tax=Nocardioides panaciterrulae TaxID=661492 RepID=A0A7Y9E959_9ACTN|nr:hypothetical protein [Nocardioides panaciterrulae]NYD43186.1 hypothetical protein [Nocardioides panaciterrulae]